VKPYIVSLTIAATLCLAGALLCDLTKLAVTSITIISTGVVVAIVSFVGLLAGLETQQEKRK